MGTKNLNSATDLITFTRASGGTALRKISYGNELLTNGTFDTDISGWEGSHGTSTQEFDNGTIKLGHTGYNQWSRQVISGLVVGNTYQVKFSVTNDTQGSGGGSFVGMYLNNSDYSYFLRFNYTRGVVRSYTFDFTATATTSQIRLYKGSNTGTTNFDNVSVKERLYDQPDGTLQLWNHSNNEPRIEYDATGAVKGLLIEEARTNMLTYSNDFTNAAWTKARAEIDTPYVSPDGSSNASKFISTSGESTARTYRSLVGSFNSGGSMTGFMKAGSSGVYGWIEAVCSGGVRAYAVFNLENGTVVNSDLCSASLEPVGNGWFRCVVANIGVACTYYGIGGSDNTFTGNPWDNSRLTTGKFIYIYGAQFEAGSFPTSYIPTSGSTATRAADVATIPTSAFGYNQKVGSVLFEGNVIKANIGTTIDRRIVEISDGTTTNFISVYQDVSMDQNLRIANQDAGVLSVNADTGYTLSDAQTFKVAIGIKLNNFAVSVDGGAVVTDTTGTVSNTLSQIDIGKLGGGTQYLNGYIKSIKYYPRRLTNTQLQELTT